MATNQQHSSDYDLTRYTNRGGFKDRSAPIRSRKIPIAIFGLGRAGIIHLENALNIPRFHVRYIVDKSEERLAQIQANFGLDDDTLLLTEDKTGTVLTDNSIVAVIVATPSNDHERYALPALKAGKHVLCEKPVALDEPAISNCYKVAEENNKILLCAFNRRYDPALSALRDQVKAGAIGQIHTINSVARDSPKPTMDYLKISGGIFHDCIIHDIDLICNFVMQERPHKVFTVANAFDPKIAALNDYDTVSVTLQFKSGAIGHIDISREAVYGYDQRLEVLGNKGMLKSENQRPDSLMFSRKDGCTLNPILHSFASRYKEAYTRQMETFLDLIDGKKQMEVTEAHVIDSMKIIDALEESIKTEGLVTVKY